jgi:hypothetical protein
LGEGEGGGVVFVDTQGEIATAVCAEFPETVRPEPAEGSLRGGGDPPAYPLRVLSKDGRSPLVFKFKINTVGVARQLVTFSCFAKEKVTKKKATPVYRPFGVPSIFLQQAGLRNSPWRGTHPVPHCGAQTVLA